MIIIYIIAGIMAAFILLQLFMRISMKLKKGKPAPTLTGKAGSAVKKGKKALFYFYSPQCGACKPMTPFIQGMAKKKKNVFPVNIVNDMDTARKFGVMGTPSTVLVESGTIKEFLVGPKTESEISALMQS